MILTLMTCQIMNFNRTFTSARNKRKKTAKRHRNLRIKINHLPRKPKLKQTRISILNSEDRCFKETFILETDFSLDQDHLAKEISLKRSNPKSIPNMMKIERNYPRTINLDNDSNLKRILIQITNEPSFWEKGVKISKVKNL